MNAKNTTKNFIITLATMFALVCGAAASFGQEKSDGQTILSGGDSSSDLVGVWEEVAPSTIDCTTHQPNGPVINILYTINQGGTMYEEDTLPDDRNRTTGGGIWKRLSGRNYSYVALHYSFDENKNFLFTIKQRSTVRLNRTGNSFTEDGTFKAIAPNGNVLFNGCFAATARRVTF